MRHPHPTRFSPAPLALAAAIVLGAPALANAQAVADTQPIAISIAAQPLGDALNELAAAVGTPIAFSQALVAGKTSPTVKGTLTAQQALAQLLAGSGLAAHQEGGIIVIIRSATPNTETESTLPAVKVMAQSVRDAVTEGSASYAASAATIAKGNQRLKDIPQSVSVMTRQRIEDQNLETLSEVLEQTPGITLTQTGNAMAEGRSGSFSARGYQLENYMINGAPVNSGDNWAGDMLVNGSSGIYDRVEVLRGAAGLLVGNGTPGAVVNLERKRPLEQNQIGLLLSAGSWNKYRGEVDISRVLTQSGNVRGRMVMSYEDSARFWKLTNSTNPLAYGVLDIDLTDRTTLSFGGLYEKYRETSPWAPMTRGEVFPGGWEYLGQRDNPAGRDWTYYQKETKEYFATLEHRFNDRWKSKTNLTHQTQTSDFLLHAVYVSSGEYPNYPVSDRNGLQALYRKPSDVTNIAIDSNIVGDFDLFGKTHELVLGANWFNTEKNLYTNVYYPWRDQHGTVIDIRESFNNGSYLPKPEIPDNARRGNPVDDSRYGVYSTLRLTLADPLKLILGARLSYYDYEQRDWATGIKTADRHVDAELTPFAGIVYALNKQWSLYGSYADIFNPQFGQFTASGGGLDPVIGANYELGVKGELFGGALNASLALFRIDETNRALVDPRWPDAKIEPCPGNPNGGVCYYNGGERRSKGVELEINGELLPGWQAGFGYTYNTTKVIKDRNSSDVPTNAEGKPFSVHTPKHLLKAWTSYRFSGDWAGLRVGGGVSAQSKAQDAGWYIRDYPGRAVYSLFGAYDIDKTWSVSANVSNLFDKKYFLTGNSGAGRWGEPRSINVSLRGKF